MITPIVIALAVALPATFGASDLITLAKNRPHSRRARRELTRRATILLAAAAIAAAAAIHNWRG